MPSPYPFPPLTPEDRVAPATITFRPSEEDLRAIALVARHIHPIGFHRAPISMIVRHALLAAAMEAARALKVPLVGSVQPVAVDEPQTPAAADRTPQAGTMPIDRTKALLVHTDGACPGNPGPGGWGVVFSQGMKVVGEFSGHEPSSTNNRMELTAIREAIKRAPVGVALVIGTDSANAIGWLAEGWKRKDPTIAALCQQIDTLRQERADAHGEEGDKVSFWHVRGHRGDPMNEAADQLATEAARTKLTVGAPRQV